VPPAIGTEAPDFTLRDQNNAEVTLSAFRGRCAVLLVFYPFAFSRVCTGELGAIRDHLDAFQNDRVRVLGISVDHPFALKAWSQSERYEFPLLSDFWPHGALARCYGVLQEDKGFALRGTFLVDFEGTIRFSEVNEPGQPRDQGVWKTALAAL
jgi:peroxiredoxin (alkyl hydroperoxide reductase subunit C)